MRVAFLIRTTDSSAHAHGRPAATASRLAALALAALVAHGAISSARAAVMDASHAQTRTIPLTQTNWGPGTGGLANPLTFDKFDPAVGTLNSVSIQLGYQFTHDVSLTFTSPSTLTESTVGSQVVVLKPDSSGAYLTGTPTPISESRTDTTGPYLKTITIPTISQNGTAGPLTLSTPAELALFTGLASGDKIGLPVTAQSNSVFSSSTGNGSGRILTNAGADVTVTYNYTPIPEPSTLAIMGLGGAAAFAHARRRARRSQNAS